MAATTSPRSRNSSVYSALLGFSSPWRFAHGDVATMYPWEFDPNAWRSAQLSVPRHPGHGGWIARLQNHIGLVRRDPWLGAARRMQRPPVFGDELPPLCCDSSMCVLSHHGADVEGVGHRLQSLGKGCGAVAVSRIKHTWPKFCLRTKYYCKLAHRVGKTDPTLMGNTRTYG